MLNSKRNPFVDLLKAAVGLSSGTSCTCGTAAANEPLAQTAVTEQQSRTGACGCREQVTYASSEQNADECGCGG